MRLSILVSALLSASLINASIIPDTSALSQRDANPLADIQSLEKRKGGGGGGKSGGGSSSSGSSGSSSGAKSGSSSSGSSSSRGSTSSNAGGRTVSGSGPPRAYGGYYGGGSSVPYTAGQRSSLGLLPIGLFGVASLALLWPALWLSSAYYYPWSHPYSFYNASAQQNQTKPVLCVCQEDAVCGCDENTNSSYMTSVIGDGDFAKLNRSLAYVNDVNGTSTILINGTLPNGTTADGGTESASAAAALRAGAGQAGFVTLAVGVFWFVWM